MVEQLLTLKDGLGHPDPAILFHTCHSVAQVPARASAREGGAAPSGPRGPLRQLVSCTGSTGAGPGTWTGLTQRVRCPAPPPAPSCACWGPPSLRGPAGRVWAGAQLRPQRVEKAAPSPPVSPQARAALLSHLVTGNGPQGSGGFLSSQRRKGRGSTGPFVGWGRAQTLGSGGPALGESRHSGTLCLGSDFMGIKPLLFLLCTKFICFNFWLLSFMWREGQGLQGELKVRRVLVAGRSRVEHATIYP